MPAYDFQCTACGLVFEHRLTMTEYEREVRPKCSACGASQPKRIFSAEVNILTSPVPVRWREKQKPQIPGGCGGGSCGCSCG